MTRHVAYEDDDIILEVQIHDGYPVIHCEMLNWSPSISRKALLVWEEFKKEMKNNEMNILFTIVPKSNIKALKFNRMFGFEKVGEFKNSDIMRQVI